MERIHLDHFNFKPTTLAANPIAGDSRQNLLCKLAPLFRANLVPFSCTIPMVICGEIGHI